MNKLKRHLTNMEVSSDANVPVFASMAPPLPVPSFPTGDQEQLFLPVVKRVRDHAMQPPSGVHLRRQLTPLTPKISWAAILGESKEDLMEVSPILENGSATPRGSGDRYTSPPRACSPPMRKASGFGFDSPPARPEKPPRNAFLSQPISNPLACRATDDGYDRFAREFENAKVVGSGCFSVVLRARNRVDKQEYAIKKTKNPLARGTKRRAEMLQEALALASVAIENPCQYIVRYFSSWIEDERLFIQTELCDGSVTDLMVSLRRIRPHDPRFTDAELSAVMSDVCKGLQVLHGKNLVHLDVKPDNILTKRAIASPSRARTATVHKIADLGLATAAIGSGYDEISEGDSRYLARELLKGDLSDLKKADVFSLGLMCYELATNPKGLPCGGDEWQRLRDGHLEVAFANQLSSPMLELMVSMVRPIAANRPSCTEMLNSGVLASQASAGGDPSLVESLQNELRQRTEAAEQERKMRTDAEQQVASAEQKMVSAEEKADRYWSELLHMKREEMLREVPHDTATVVSQLPQQTQQSQTFRFKRSKTT